MRSSIFSFLLICLVYEAYAQSLGNTKADRIDYFNQWKGKIVRNITYTNKLKEVRSNPNKPVRQKFIKAYNGLNDALNRNTNLHRLADYNLVKKGQEVEGEYFVECERILRSNSFIYEANYTILDIPDIVDSVDLEINTIGRVSLLPFVGISSAQKFNIGLRENNFLGNTNQARLQVYYDASSDAKVRSNQSFRLRNPSGNYIDYDFIFNTATNDLSSGLRAENSIILRAQRPFISNLMHWQGEALAGYFFSANYYNQPKYHIDYRYGYGLVDSWVGRYIPLGNWAKQRVDDWYLFSGIRGIVLHFFDTPNIILPENAFKVVNLRTGLLNFSLIQRRFERYQYLFDLGRPEDLEQGKNFSLTFGFGNREGNIGTYLGLETQVIGKLSKDNYYNLSVKLGGFFENNGVKDLTPLIDLLIAGSLVDLGTCYFRNYYSWVYSGIYHQSYYPLLALSNNYSMYNYPSSDFRATDRFAFRTESILFFKNEILGFKLAPLINTQWALLINTQERIQQFHTAFGLGLRIRNNQYSSRNLDIRGFIYPYHLKHETGHSGFGFDMTTKFNFQNFIRLASKPNFIGPF